MNNSQVWKYFHITNNESDNNTNSSRLNCVFEKCACRILLLILHSGFWNRIFVPFKVKKRPQLSFLFFFFSFLIVWNNSLSTASQLQSAMWCHWCTKSWMIMHKEHKLDCHWISLFFFSHVFRTTRWRSYY